MNEKDLKELKELEEKYKRKTVDVNFKSVERVAKALKVIIVGAIIPLILILALIVVIAFLIIYAYWYVDKESIIGHLEEIYLDKYTVISKDVNEDGEGYYKIAIKDNEEIVFNGYHEGNNTNIEDSQAHKLKYYFEHLDDEELKKNFVGDESYYKVNEKDSQEFLKYDLKTYVSSYEEIDEAVLNCYRMVQYCKEKEIYGYVIFYIYGDYWGGFGQSDEDREYEELLNREKNNYIKFAMENNIKINEISEEDLEKYYRPDLKIILNGKELEEYNDVNYNYEIGEYEIKYFQRVIDNVDNVEKLLYNMGNVIKIKYNGKEYKLHYDNNELKKNSIPYVCRISYIEEIFGSEVKYDLKNKKIYITIK